MDSTITAEDAGMDGPSTRHRGMPAEWEHAASEPQEVGGARSQGRTRTVRPSNDTRSPSRS